ncbi:MAG: 6-phosphofructokinase [Bacteroidales bacterium]|jgi:6-phosphofructokinase 1|nr:6-phosphofructokinase [Bacteroidales bacterium]
MKGLQKIGILTSGGDAPGMNAAIRAVTRTAINNGLQVEGIIAGYKGLLFKEFIALNSQSVSGIIQTGGTILRTARCPEFMDYSCRKTAIENLQSEGIDALVVLGGDGTFRGAAAISKEFDFPIIGIPCTIDNDICGTDYTIGSDTCLNTVVNAVDNIRDTASSHNRIFFVEVMGHESGSVAMHSGLACGAEIILIPEQHNQIERARQFLAERAMQNKSSVIMVAEGVHGGATQIAEQLSAEFPQFEMRVSVLGYIQRGGRPSAYDRTTASQFGVAAVHSLLNGKTNMMVGLMNGKIHLEPFQTAVKMHKKASETFVMVAESIGTFTPMD